MMISIMKTTRFVLTVGEPFPFTAQGTNTSREMFARLSPRPQCQPVSFCTISGGVDVCPTADTDRVRLKVLMAAKNHGIDEISVPNDTLKVIEHIY